MSLLFKLAAVALLHILFFAAYPETGPYGNYYLGVSLLLWTGFSLFLGTAVKLLKFLSGPLGALLNAAILLLTGLALALTMPQADRTSVLEKLQAGRYPDRATLNRGMRRFGIKLDKELEKGAEQLKDAAEDLRGQAGGEIKDQADELKTRAQRAAGQ